MSTGILFFFRFVKKSLEKNEHSRASALLILKTVIQCIVIYQWNIRQFVYQWSPKVANVSPKRFKQ
jgi:hypothetical protein